MTGVTKAILNGDINSELAQIFPNSGQNLARNVSAECYRYLQHTEVSSLLDASVWGAQLGVRWSDISTRPPSVDTLSFVLLRRNFGWPFETGEYDRH